MVELTVPVKVDDDEKKEPMPEPSPAPVLEQELETPTQSKTPSVNPFDSIPSISESAERVAKDIKNLVPEIDPDKYAEAQRTADRLPGSNADDVYEDLKPYKQAEQKNAFDRIVDKNPATARFFNKEKNVKIAGDSAEELSAFESLYTYGGRSVARGGIRIGQMYQQYIGEQSAEQALDSKRTFMEILRTERPDVATSTVGVYNPVDVLFAAERFVTSRIFSSKDALDAASYRLGKVQDLLTLSETEYGMAQKDHLEAIVKAGEDSPLPAIEVALRSPAKSLALALEIAGEFAPQLAVSGITTAIGGPAAGTAMLGLQSGLVERFVSPAEYFGKRGYDLGKPEDIRKIINDPDIMSEAQRYGLDRAVIIGAMDAISGGVASQYYGSVLRTFLVNTVAQPALGGGGEALAQLKTQGKVENWGEVVLEAMAEFATMPVEVSMLGGRAIRDARNARTAKNKVELARQANELAKNSKLAERSKDVAEEHRADVLRENSVDKVTIDAEKFTQYMQDEGDPDFAASLGLTEEGLQEALELGAEIRLDADGYAHLIGRESYDKIADDVRFDEDGMTGAEAKNYEENIITEEITKFYEEFESFDVDKQVAINTIRQEVEAQVRASGRSDNEAQFLGMLLGERYATRSERSGMSPLEMWRRDNVRLAGPSEQVPGFDSIDLAIDRFRGGVPADQFFKLAKTPMIDTLVRQGGVDPTGRFAGELAARGITPKTNPRLFKKDGIKDADTLVQEELGFLDAEPATETGYVDPDLVVDAVEAEVGGTPYRSLAEQDAIAGYDANIAEISRIIDAAGLTAESSPQEIRAAVDAAVGGARQFKQIDYSRRGDIVEINKIEIPKDKRGQGLADQELKELIARADVSGITLALTPSDAFGSSKSRLTRWYKRNGFVPNKGKNKNFGTRESFIRTPQATDAAVGDTRQFEQTDTGSEAFKDWFGDSKVVDENGEPLVVYHGTGNIENMEEFLPALTGQGNDQLGSGFYFTTNPSEASGYTTAVTANAKPGAPKLGGDSSPGIVPAYLSIQNPIEVQNGNLTNVDFDINAEQAEAIIRRSPSLMNLEDSPIGNWHDIWSEGIQEWMVADVASNYTGKSLISLENDFFRGEAQEFRAALRDVLGFDGVTMSFDDGQKHHVAWFPEQIKSQFNRGTFDPDDPRVLFQPNPDNHQDRISTRQPTTKFATEDPLTEDLVIDLDTMKRDRNTFEYNMREIVGRYRNVKESDAALPADQLAKKFTNHIVSNLLYLYDQVPAATRDRSRLWYDGARALTDRWSAKYNVPDRVIAGVLASLSPQKDWFMNVSLAERVLDIMTNQQNHRFDDAMLKTARSSVLAVKKGSKPIVGRINPAYQRALAEISDKTLAEVSDPKHKAIWLRIYDETYNDRRHRIVTPEGEFADWARGTAENTIDDMGEMTPLGQEKKTGWGSFPEITKAVNVILNPSPESISREMGAKHKVRNFFNNILSPNAAQQDVTIDTHAVAAALLQALSGNSREVYHNFGTGPTGEKRPPNWMAAKNYKGNGVEGLYGLYADAYRAAAKKRGVSARQMQSITWEAARGLFTATYKQDASNIEAIERIWDNYRNGTISIQKARKEVFSHAGGINPPEWEGRDSGITGGEFNSSYTDELSRSGIPGFEAGLSPSGIGGRFTGILAGQGLEPSGVFLQPSRGSIELRAHETVIRLGKDADPSTFLHENGHLFLEQLKSDAKEFGTKQLVDDWNITRNWWGSNSESIRREAIRYAKKKGDSESAAALDKMTEGAVRAYVRSGDLTGGKEYKGKGGSTTAMQYLTEAMHEQYARGFEDYLRTGQAPSVQLQGAFNRFRAWLVSVYTAIQRRLGRDILDVQYSPEVAGVMDRLLASDTDIELVREQYNLKALYDSAEEAGMTPKQFEVYQLQVARAVEQSKTRQLKKHLNEAEREQEDFWEAEGEQIAVGIRSELAQEPVYKALWTLTQKTLADGSLLPADFSIDRLDRKAVIEVLQSAKSLARLPKVKGKAIYATRTKESSVHPDVAAQMFGFQNSMEMLQQMAAARPFEEVVQERVDAQLKEKYGDMRNDGSAVEAAIDSVHIDETAEVLTAELNALRDSKDKMKPAFVRNWAQEKIGTRKVSELRPGEFLQAERRHAKEAGKLLRQGDRLGAQRAKFKQLMNFYMAKEAIKAREEIAKGRKYFSKFTKRRKNYKTIDADYVDQIKNILSNYQFGPRLSKDIKSWLDFAKMAEENDSATFNIPQEILDADGQTNYQDLTLDEFRTLRDAITSIEKQGREAKTVTVEGERVYLVDAEKEITDRLDDRPMTKRGVGKQRGYPDSLKGKWNEWKDKRMANLASFDASLVKIEFLAFQVDGEKVGPFHKFFFQTFADAEAARNDMVARVGKPIMDAIKNMPRKMQRALGTSIYVPELNRNFKRSEIIVMALNTGNESNRDKLIRGSMKDVYDSSALTEELLDKILDNLVLEEWQFVQTVWDSFQEMYPDVEAVFRKENGRSPETIDAVPFIREFDGKTYEFRGGYFPMMYDHGRSAQGADIKQKTALEAMQAQGNQAGVFSGMTKERTAGFAVPVSLDISAIPQHLERTAHYITHYEAVRTTNKLLRREKLNKAIVQTMGNEYFQVLNNWMGAVAANQAPQVQSEFWSKVIKFFRTNATIAIMGFSFTTGIAQTLGLFTSIDALSQQPDGKYNFLVGKKWLINGMWHYLKNPAQSIRMIKELSGEMRHRIYNTDRDVSYAMRQFERSAAGQSMMKGGYKEFQRFSMMAIAGIQVLMVDYPTWMGAYNKALAEGKAPGDAVNYADSIIRTSQTAGGLKDMSSAQMNETMAPFMMFYSFFNVLYNIERQIAGGLKENGIKDVPQAAARVFIVMALPTIIENIYKDKWPDEDEDEDGVISGWDYAKWTAMKTAYFGLSSVPLLRDIAGGAFTGFGYSLSPMDSLGDSVVRSIQSISKMIDEGDPEMTQSRVKAIVGTIGFGIGFPVVQLNREVKTWLAMEEGEDVDWYDWLIGYRDASKSAFKN